MSLQDVVNLTISRSAPAVSRQGFGVALILGSETLTSWGSDRIRSYTKAADLLADGFTTSDATYKHALALMGQPNKPTKFKVGRRLALVAQVDTETPDVSTQSVQHYIVTIDGVAYDFTSDSSPTASEVVTGVNALINADSACAAAATGTTTIILTAKTPGVGFTTTVSANLTQVHTTANVGIASDLPQIQAIDDDWYALDVTTIVDGEILAAAAFIESVRKIFVVATNEAGILTSGSTDIASKLKTKSYARTAILFSADYIDGAAASWLGYNLPLQPGSATYKFKSLPGITADVLTSTQYGFAKGKNCNVYTTVGGLGMTEEGVMAVGEYIDVIVGVDWIYANMQADVFQALMDNDKIPYTDVGAGVIEAAIRTRLTLAEKANILAPGTQVVTVPKVSAQSSGSKAARDFPGITFSQELAGAIHKVDITGNVYP